MYKKISFISCLILMIAVISSGCVPPAAETPAAEAPATEAPAVEAPAVTEAPALPVPGGENRLVLATTTSTDDSGLLDFLLPDFEEANGVSIDVIAVGTGQALQIGMDGNADVLLVHARAKEDEFMAAKHGIRREDVMYNDFVIIGPETDPAGIKGSATAVDVLKKIAETKSVFISRGDGSGTDVKEKSLWAAAGIKPAGDWYVSSGQGMGEVLTMANEQLAYTLSDRATYLARTKEGLDLVVLVEGDPILFNPYGVIAVNPAKNSNIQADLSQKFIDWIISIPVQEKIASFGKEEFGQSLFVPDSTLYKEAQASVEAAPVGEAALKITGMVASEQALSEDEIKALPSISVESTNKAGEKVTSTGVLLSELLKLAEPAAEATTIVFVADDGYTAETALAEVTACTNCILAFREDGGFGIVMPDASTKLQVKGVIEIQVK